jgi:hypothetical protein
VHFVCHHTNLCHDNNRYDKEHPARYTMKIRGRCHNIVHGKGTKSKKKKNNKEWVGIHLHTA